MIDRQSAVIAETENAVAADPAIHETTTAEEHLHGAVRPHQGLTDW